MPVNCLGKEQHDKSNKNKTLPNRRDRRQPQPTAENWPRMSGGGFPPNIPQPPVAPSPPAPVIIFNNTFK